MERAPTDRATVSRLRTAALVMSAGWILATMALARLIEAVLKSLNPDRVDVTQPLAYLRPLLIVSFVIGAVLLLLTVVLNLVLQRREGSASARPAWIVFGVQAALVVIMLALQGWVNAITGG